MIYSLKKRIANILIIALAVTTIGFSPVSHLTGGAVNSIGAQSVSALSYDIPSFEGTVYTNLNNGIPKFSHMDKQRTDPFEEYSQLDELGRCGIAYANICKELMPTQERGDISSVHPTGWQTGVGYNRCHLIGFQLAGENANQLNLITGTQYFNVSGMLPFENLIDDYVDETGNHVLYRVTPIFHDDELVARGVQMEAWSVEDQGDGICFNVFCFNVFKNNSPTIDYKTGIVSMTQLDQTIAASTTAKTIQVKKALTSKKTFSMGITTSSGNKYCTKKSGSKYLSVSTAGTVSIKKGTPIGKYTMIVKVYAQGDSRYNSKSKNITVTVDVKKLSKIQKITTGKLSKTYTVTKKLTTAKSFSLNVKTSSGNKACTKASGSKYLSISKKGTVTVKKGTPIGKHTMKVKIYAKGDSWYNSKTAKKTVSIYVKKVSTPAGTVYWTKTGSCYHSTKDCSSLARSKVIISGDLTEARNNGLSSCSFCY